jgi:hypothetical protein
MGGDMTGRSLTGEMILGEGSILEEGTVFLVWHIFWCWEFGFGGFGESLQGAPGCWGFWARGPGFLSVSWS